jgi:hypothetical protein
VSCALNNALKVKLDGKRLVIFKEKPNLFNEILMMGKGHPMGIDWSSLLNPLRIIIIWKEQLS